MKCRSCGFENMKNATVCGRCNAKLVWDGPKGRAHFTPGRSESVVRRPGFLASLRLRLRPLFDAWAGLPREDAGAMVLSALPGLGHVVTSRYRRAALYFVLWALLLVGAMAYSRTYLDVDTGRVSFHRDVGALGVQRHVNRYGAPMWGMALMGLALMVHLGAVMDAGRVARYAEKTRGAVLIFSIPVSLLLGVVYYLLMNILLVFNPAE